MSKVNLSIPVWVRTQDNGDGGYTITGYNSSQELLENHPKYHRATVEEKEAVAKEILNEEDPYENGYISQDSIEIIYDQTTGKAELLSCLHFHAGQ